MPLRLHRRGAQYQRPAQHQTHPHLGTHSSFSSSLPNRVALFAAAISFQFSLTACRSPCGNLSFPTSKSTWIQSPARSSFTGNPSAPSELPPHPHAQAIAASSVSSGTVPGSGVKSPESSPTRDPRGESARISLVLLSSRFAAPAHSSAPFSVFRLPDSALAASSTNLSRPQELPPQPRPTPPRPPPVPVF